MQQMMMCVRDGTGTSAIREGHGAPKPEYIELNDDVTESKDLLYVLKKECLERRALTKVQRLPSIDDAALRTLSKGSSKKPLSDTAKTTSGRRNTSSSQGPRTVEKRKIKKEDRDVSSSGDKLTAHRTEGRNRSQQDRIYFLSEKYEDVSGDESQTLEPLQSAGDVSHDVIERFLPLVDAMEQVVPTDGEDLPDEGGLIIDDAVSPANGVSIKLTGESPVRNAEKYSVSSEMPQCQSVGAPTPRTSSIQDDECSKELTASTSVEAETSRTEREPAKSRPQTTGPKAKKARVSGRARKPSALLEMLRGKASSKSSSGTGRTQGPLRRQKSHSGSQGQHNDGGSGSEALTDEDSSSTTLDGTEYQMSSDEDSKKVRTADPDDTVHRPGTKRTIRSAEELRKSIVKDPLNEESRYNRLVQELPGFNWLEQKIMGHAAAAVKPAVTKPAAAISEEAPCRKREPTDAREMKIASGADILSRSMSEIQDDVVFPESSEVATIIKCASTQTELLHGGPTQGCIAPPADPKREPQAPDVLSGGGCLPVPSTHTVPATVLHCPPAMPAMVQNVRKPVTAIESEKAVVTSPPRRTEVPGEAPRTRTNNIVSPDNSPDVTYLGVVEKQLEKDSLARVPCSPSSNGHPHPLVARTETGLARAQEPEQATNTDPRQKALGDAQRQAFPWFLGQDGNAHPSICSSSLVQPFPAQLPLQGLADMCQHSPTVHNIVPVANKMQPQQPVVVAPQQPYQHPVALHGEMHPRPDGMPFYPFLGFPQPQYFIPYRTSAQVEESRQANPNTIAQQEHPPANIQGQQCARFGEARTNKEERDGQMQKNVPILPKPSTAVHQNPSPLQPHQRLQHPGEVEVARCSPVRRPVGRAKPNQCSLRRERVARPPVETERRSPTKIAEYNSPPPLSVPHPQPQGPQEATRISPAVQRPEMRTPEHTEGTSTERELMKRKDELKYLDHLASQKEAEYDRLLQMRTEKLRILTELENKIKSSSEHEKLRTEKDNQIAVTSRPPYAHQEMRNAPSSVYKEAATDRNGTARGTPQKCVTESQKGPPTVTPPAVPPPGNYPGLVPHYPVHPPPNSTIPVMPPANIPMTVPLLGRGLFNVRSIDIPRDISQVMVHGNTLHPGQERRPDFHADQRQQLTGHQNTHRSAPVKRAHPADDVDAGKQDGSCATAGGSVTVQHHTVQRPLPHRASKPPPPPEPRNIQWPMKENYRPDIAAYYNHPSFPFQAYYPGKTVEANCIHHTGVQHNAVQHSGVPRTNFGYFQPYGDYGAGMHEKFSHHPSQPNVSQEHRESGNNTEQNSKKTVGVDNGPSKRCSGEEQMFYLHGRPIPRDVAPVRNPAVHPGRYETDQSRNQRQVPQGPHQPQATKEESSKCARCGKYAHYLCSGCQSTWYCGQQCQRSNWTEHSAQCRGIKR